MAIYTVELDGNQFDIEGPDGASEADLLNAAREHQGGVQTPPESTPPAQPTESKTRQFIRKAANALPTVGAIGGGTVAGLGGAAATFGVGGIPGAAIGAGVGGAAGEGLRQAILSALGDQAPTLGEAAGAVGKTAALEGALTLAGGKLLQGVGKGGRLIKDLVVKPGAAEVALAGKEALIDIGEKGAEKLALARATKEAAKKGLIEAEEKAGLHFESTPGFEEYLKDPKKMADFATKIGRLAKQAPEELAKKIPSEQLQLFRKIAQEGEKISNLSDIAKSQLRNGKDIVTQALGHAEQGIGEQLGRFREAGRVVEEIPGQIKEQLIKHKSKVAREVLDAKSLDRKRKVVKGLAAATAGYFGLKSLIK